MSKPSTFVLLSLFALSATGCATVFKSSKADVEVRSNPAGVELREEGRPVGTTPAVLHVNRARATTVQASKPGYETRAIHVKTEPDTAWWIWDIGTCIIPVTMCIPVIVDAVSGAWMTVEEDGYEITLKPSTGTVITTGVPTAGPASSAQQAVDAADLSSCHPPRPGHATVTFDPGGSPTKIVVGDTSPRLSTEQLNCIAARLGAVRIAPDAKPSTVLRTW